MKIPDKERELPDPNKGGVIDLFAQVKDPPMTGLHIEPSNKETRKDKPHDS